MVSPEFIEQFKRGEDVGFRENVCSRLESLITESDRGEASTADFKDRLSEILGEIKELEQFWPN